MRLTFRQTHLYRFVNMAELEGFEPPDGLTRQLISSQPRYDHFDTSPCCIFKALRVSG